jgi:hypothetical protein
MAAARLVSLDKNPLYKEPLLVEIFPALSSLTIVF